MASPREWLEGARLRTLTASTSPVVAGTGLAWFVGGVQPAGGNPLQMSGVSLTILCFVVALGFQVGSNYANDYSDGIRGTDDTRVGPMRLVGSGAATPRAVRGAAGASGLIACLAGLAVVAITHAWILVLVGLACALAAWFYTGGKRPYGYAGLGEVFVFLFFGLAATLGTVFAHDQARWRYFWPETPRLAQGPMWEAGVVTAIVMGCFSTAILVANNLRDIDTDAGAGKRTLGVRMGQGRTRGFFALLLVVAGLGLVSLGVLTTWWALGSLVGLVVVLPSAIRVLKGASGRDLIRVLKLTGLAEMVCALALFFAWMVDWFHG